jgi:hypothetical protein
MHCFDGYWFLTVRVCQIWMLWTSQTFQMFFDMICIKSELIQKVRNPFTNDRLF